MKLCFFASLLLCDKECFNAEMAEEQRGENLTIVIKGAIGLGESLGEGGGSFADGVRKMV